VTDSSTPPVTEDIEHCRQEIEKLRRTIAIYLPAPRRDWTTTLVAIVDDVLDVIGDVAAGR
jgi:translation elongation factor EF-Tu-like GTPase